MPASTIDPLVLQARLTAARAAYDRLITGGMREKVEHNGTSITYSRADAASLLKYINDLEGDLVETQRPPTRRRMIVNWF